jgi:hypothetical protein
MKKHICIRKKNHHNDGSIIDEQKWCWTFSEAKERFIPNPKNESLRELTQQEVSYFLDKTDRDLGITFLLDQYNTLEEIMQNHLELFL